MIRVRTAALCALLADLALTTTTEDGAYPALAGVLLHTGRGYPYPDEPGRSDVLVGTSTNRQIGAQAFTGCEGQLSVPMLWPVSKVESVIRVFKPKLKGDKEHGVTITRDGDHVVVREDPNLFTDGDRIEFKLGDPEHAPFGKLAELIGTMPRSAAASRSPFQLKPRTDFAPGDLKLLCQIAINRKALIETYRVDQESRLLLQIGPYWAGFIKPRLYEQDKQSDTIGYAPDGDVYEIDLPEPELDLLAEDLTPAPALVDDPVLPLEPVEVTVP